MREVPVEFRVFGHFELFSDTLLCFLVKLQTGLLFVCLDWPTGRKMIHFEIRSQRVNKFLD